MSIGRIGNPYSRQDLDRMREMVAAKIKGTEIARTFCTTPERLYTLFNYHGISITPRKKAPHIRKAFTEEARRRGMTPYQLRELIVEAVTRENLFTAVLDS